MKQMQLEVEKTRTSVPFKNEKEPRSLEEEIRRNMKHVNREHFPERERVLQMMNGHKIEIDRKEPEKKKEAMSLTMQVYSEMQKMKVKDKDFLKERKEPHVKTVVIAPAQDNPLDIFMQKDLGKHKVLILDENNQAVGEPVPLGDIMHLYEMGNGTPEYLQGKGLSTDVASIETPEFIYTRKMEAPEREVYEFAGALDYNQDGDKIEAAVFGYDRNGEYEEKEFSITPDGQVYEEIWEKEPDEREHDEYERDDDEEEMIHTWGD